MNDDIKRYDVSVFGGCVRYDETNDGKVIMADDIKHLLYQPKHKSIDLPTTSEMCDKLDIREKSLEGIRVSQTIDYIKTLNTSPKETQQEQTEPISRNCSNCKTHLDCVSLGVSGRGGCKDFEKEQHTDKGDYVRIYDYEYNNGHWGYTEPKSRICRSQFDHIIIREGVYFGSFEKPTPQQPQEIENDNNLVCGVDHSGGGDYTAISFVRKEGDIMTIENSILMTHEQYELLKNTITGREQQCNTY